MSEWRRTQYAKYRMAVRDGEFEGSFSDWLNVLEIDHDTMIHTEERNDILVAVGGTSYYNGDDNIYYREDEEC